MLSTALAIDWDTLIEETAPVLKGKTISDLIGGTGATGPGPGGRGFAGISLFILFFSGAALLLYLLYGGLQLLTSGGDPKKIQSGKETITHALIGFVIVFAAYWIVQIISLFLGLNGFSGTF